MAFAVVVNVVEKMGSERERRVRDEQRKEIERQSDERERDKVVAKSAFSCSGSINRQGAQ